LESIQYLNENPGVTGEMSVQFDIATGYARTYGAGFWSAKQVTAFFNEWRQIIRDMHANGISLSALADMGEGQVQSSEVAEIIANATSNMYRDGDSIAMLVPSSLAKMQLRRLLDARYHAFFISRSAAELWLQGRASSVPIGMRSAS
jgi:hypothetical protein